MLILKTTSSFIGKYRYRRANEMNGLLYYSSKHKCPRKETDLCRAA